MQRSIHISQNRDASTGVSGGRTSCARRMEWMLNSTILITYPVFSPAVAFSRPTGANTRLPRFRSTWGRSRLPVWMWRSNPTRSERGAGNRETGRSFPPRLHLIPSLHLVRPAVLCNGVFLSSSAVITPPSSPTSPALRPCQSQGSPARLFPARPSDT